jgi:K(+)-stimulated pyrophosphate-energized sodium pump
MSVNYALIAILSGSILALIYAFFRTVWIFKQPVEKENLKTISGYVAEGAMAFLTREYKVLIPFVLIVAAALAVANQGYLKLQALAFVTGAVTSALSGFIGMKVATAANSRTTNAAQKGLNEALKVAFSGGSVMGMSVVGLALLGLFTVMVVAITIIGDDIVSLTKYVLPVVSGFSLGASSIALFARVGGGIYTKAADVGADLVGKVEAGIPEDDPRNPAVIADNVGDNVGDVAGMGADLFESFVGSLVGAMILGLAVDGSDEIKFKLLTLPMALTAIGVVASIIGVFFVKAKPGTNPQKALNFGTFGAAILATILAFFVTKYIVGTETYGNNIGYLQVFFSAVIGLAGGTAIGLLTEFFTGKGTKPVNIIVKASETGAATNLITGMGMGMLSTFPPVIVIAAALVGSFALAGLYGIAVAALGMLLTLGIQLAVDAYGPIADNAGGLAEMAGFPPEVREITDSLDAVGNTTAAIGKGFAIGSAALTAIILFTAFQETTGVKDVNITNIYVLAGLFLGGVIPFLFSSMSMMAVGRAANAMIEEVRSQFKAKPGILLNTEKPDYKKCVDISTKAALKEMLLPGIIAVLAPVLVGFIGGIGMLIGMLSGVTVSGVVLAIFMANSGGAWDNAKKTIEGGAAGGKGSVAHKAAVVGDTVGDPFKDTSGPALNILIKLMSIISLVIAPMLKTFWGL